MARKRYVVMGAGEVGFHMARTLSQQGHSVVVIETDANKRERVEEELDAAFVHGNGAHVPVLEAAAVGHAELFLAVSSNDEANLVAAVLAKRLGARRTVVRVGVAEDITLNRRLYREVFGADLLLSTQLLATTHVLNHILGHNTLAVEYLARGKVQLRKIHLTADSPLTRSPLRDLGMPKGSLVVALYRDDALIIPAGDDQARPGDDALLVAKTSVIDRVARLANPQPSTALGTVVIAGGNLTGRTVAQALAAHVEHVKIIERDRQRAAQLAALAPRFEVIHGDATDISLLRAERVGDAQAFVALAGQDERNLMASLLAQELGVPRVIALVQRGETSHLWHKLGLVRIVSPRVIAYERIKEYIASSYSANIVSLKRGAAQVVERRLAAASPTVGVSLAEMSLPRGLIIGAVVRGKRAFVPRGDDRLEVDDTVVIFVTADEVQTVNLFFPGRDTV